MSKLIYTLLFVILCPLPLYAMTIGELLHETVGYGKPGFAITLIVGFAIAAFIGEQICKIIGKQNFGMILVIAATFAATWEMVRAGLKIVGNLLVYFPK